MIRILVIGKNGQLGKSLYKLVEKRKDYDIFTFVGRQTLDFSDDANIKHYFEKNLFNIIINCAAYTQVDKAEEEFEIANQINNLSVSALAKVAKKQNAKLIHISTDYVYDGTCKKPYFEKDCARPINAYGITKFHGELAIINTLVFNALIIRTSWVYSEFGNNFVKTILRLGKEREEINVVDDQVGSPTNAYDLASAILKIIDNKDYQNKNQPTEICHFSNEGVTSWYGFAKEIFEIAEISCKINPIKTSQYPTPAKRPLNTSMNKEKISKIFDIHVKPWKESLKTSLANSFLKQI